MLVRVRGQPSWLDLSEHTAWRWSLSVCWSFLVKWCCTLVVMKTATRRLFDEGPADLRKSVITFHTPFLLSLNLSLYRLLMIRERRCMLVLDFVPHQCPIVDSHGFTVATKPVDVSCEGCTVRAVDQRSVRRSCSWKSGNLAKVLKEARRCQLVLRASFPFRSSASEVQTKWPVGADTHWHPSFDRRQKFCESAARSDGLAKLTIALGNGDDRQTQPEIKRCGPLGSLPTRVPLGSVLMHSCISHVRPSSRTSTSLHVVALPWPKARTADALGMVDRH